MQVLQGHQEVPADVVDGGLGQPHVLPQQREQVAPHAILQNEPQVVAGLIPAPDFPSICHAAGTFLWSHLLGFIACYCNSVRTGSRLELGRILTRWDEPGLEASCASCKNLWPDAGAESSATPSSLDFQGYSVYSTACCGCCCKNQDAAPAAQCRSGRGLTTR